MPKTDVDLTDSEIQDLLRKQKRDQEIQDAANKLVDVLNRMDYSDLIPAFNEALDCQHRTLQQSFGVLVLGWLKHLSKKTEYEYDLRNEDLVNFAKAIFKHVPERDRILRFI